MKVRIIKTGEILDVNTARANYWIRCKVAEEVKEEPKTEKVDDTPIEKKAVVKKPINKKAKKK
jgi:hypothetical protein